MRISLAYTNENLEDQFDKLVTLCQEVFGQYQYLYIGIDQLISSHCLNSALVHPPYAIRARTPLSKTLRRDHQDLLIDGCKDLYKMDTSYVLFKNFTIDLYVHILIGELAGKDLRACRVVRNQYYCPHQTFLGFDHAQSCLSALFWSKESDISETCPLKPIPHADYYVQISPSKFVVALDELESVRFSCNRSAFAARDTKLKMVEFATNLPSTT